MIRSRIILVAPVLLALSCAETGKQKVDWVSDPPSEDVKQNMRSRGFPIPVDGTVFPVLKRDASSGCAVVAFDVDASGAPGNYKTYYSAPDEMFARLETTAISTHVYESDGSSHRYVLPMFKGHATKAGGDPEPPASCDKDQMKKAMRDAEQEGLNK